MTATLAAECVDIEIASDFLALTNQTNELRVVINNTTTYEPVIDADITSLTIDSELLGLEAEALANGVYYIELITTDEDGTIVTESTCIAVLCDLACDMVELYSDSANFEKVLAYEGLLAAQDCITCSCTVMQELYDIISNVVTDGCSGCD